MAKTWHVIDVRQHSTAKQSIQNLGLEVFAPECVVRIRHGRRSELVRRPMLYNYIFAEFDLSRETWKLVSTLRGVQGVMSSGGMPKVVPAAQIERVREMVAPYDGVVCEAVPLTRGQVVHIIDGAFKDHRGTIEEAVDGSSTVDLQISFMGGVIPMRVPRHQVAPVA